MLCPEARKPGDSPGGSGIAGSGGVSWRWHTTSGGTFRAWTLTVEDSGTPFLGSYGLNGWLFVGPWRDPQSGLMVSPDAPPLYTDLFLLRRTGNTPVLLDCMSTSARPTHDTPPPSAEGAPRGGGEMVGFCINRHHAHVNCLFLDWSVRKVGLKELWTLKWHKDFNTAGPWTRAGGVQPNDWPPWMEAFKDY